MAINRRSLVKAFSLISAAIALFIQCRSLNRLENSSLAGNDDWGDGNKELTGENLANGVDFPEFPLHEFTDDWSTGRTYGRGKPIKGSKLQTNELKKFLVPGNPPFAGYITMFKPPIFKNPFPVAFLIPIRSSAGGEPKLVGGHVVVGNIKFDLGSGESEQTDLVLTFLELDQNNTNPFKVIGVKHT